jgi:hypothetical protein
MQLEDGLALTVSELMSLLATHCEPTTPVTVRGEGAVGVSLRWSLTGDLDGEQVTEVDIDEDFEVEFDHGILCAEIETGFPQFIPDRIVELRKQAYEEAVEAEEERRKWHYIEMVAKWGQEMVDLAMDAVP